MDAQGITPRGQEKFWATALIAPTMVGLAFGAFGSILATLGLSLVDWDLFNPPDWMGLGNYADLPDNRKFMRALSNTLMFSAIYVPGVVVFSLFVAVLLNQRVRGKSLFRLLFFLPVVSSPTAVGLVWSWIYAKDQGVLNMIVEGLGGDPVYWLGSKMVLYSVVAVNIWGAIGEGMIIFLAGLQAIPRDVYEAAMLDGAPRHRTFLRITLPLLAPSIFFQAILSTINAFQAFDYVYILTQTQSGGSRMPTLVYNLYREGFNHFRMGDAAAQAVVLSAMIMVLTVVYNRLQKVWG